jgi:diguanylate cyclase (GGDEF)-like protein/PAS domain S-box-containing protein
VALACSAWGRTLDLPQSYQLALETAALLHDVGKIGVPESILLKPGRLSPEEAEMMARHRRMGVDILSSCCATPDVLEIVRYATAWYDGSRHGLEFKENDIPFGARLLAIADAFDAMITEHVYRPARSRERAMAELFACAGSQFDPKLVRNFSEIFAGDANHLLTSVAGHWLRAVAGQQEQIVWGFTPPSRLADESDDVTPLFESKLIDNMHDGVAFVDRELRLFAWNTGAERMTGVAAAAAQGRIWTPALLDLRNERGQRVSVEQCPVTLAVQSGVQSLTRLSIAGRSGRDVTIDLHAIPVRKADGSMLGATLLLQDASPEKSLEQQCQALQDRATRDPLTQVANRAEFDRLHELFIEAHMEGALPCSLIITDIDHFKQVNDNYGHPAGDEVLIGFAVLLKSMCRSGDVVARYGGEEFVVLCADCNNAAAAARAEQIRRKLTELQQPALGNRAITASFGVTELQPGDTPEIMLRRADRALLLAKDQGRNQVVQLGDGMSETKTKKRWWSFKPSHNRSLIDCDLVTIVPMEVAVQKLGGFIADQSAKITSTADDHLHLEVSGEKAGKLRREEDRAVPFLIELHFQEERVEKVNAQGLAAGSYLHTRVHVVIRPKKERDRRRDQAAERARHLLLSMKSYLMAQEESEIRQSSARAPQGIDVGEPQIQQAGADR